MLGRKPIWIGPPFPMPDLVYKRGMHNGYPWVITRHPEMGVYNGYVCVPEDHPWMQFGDDYYLISNNVPFGEITFRRGQWFGFDTMHSGQYWPEVVEAIEEVSPGSGDIFKKTWNNTPGIEMSIGLVAEWVVQLCTDAHDAHKDKKE